MFEVRRYDVIWCDLYCRVPNIFEFLNHVCRYLWDWNPSPTPWSSSVAYMMLSSLTFKTWETIIPKSPENRSYLLLSFFIYTYYNILYTCVENYTVLAFYIDHVPICPLLRRFAWSPWRVQSATQLVSWTPVRWKWHSWNAVV